VGGGNAVDEQVSEDDEEAMQASETFSLNGVCFSKGRIEVD